MPVEYEENEADQYEGDDDFDTIIPLANAPADEDENKPQGVIAVNDVDDDDSTDEGKEEEKPADDAKPEEKPNEKPDTKEDGKEADAKDAEKEKDGDDETDVSGDSGGDDKTYEIEGEEWSIDDLKDAAVLVSEAATRKQEAESLSEQVNGILEDAKVRPAEHLFRVMRAKLGDDDKAYEACVEVAETIVADKMRRDGMTPDQVQAEKDRTQMEKDRAELDAYRNREATANQTKEELENTTRVIADIKPVLETVGLPDSEEAIASVARVILQGREKGYNVSIARAAKAVKVEFDKRQAPDWNHVDPNTIPAEVREKWKQAEIAKFKKEKSEAAKTDDGVPSVSDEDGFKWKETF